MIRNRRPRVLGLGGVEQVIRADRPEWVPVFTGWSVGQSQELVRIVAGRGGDQSGAGRRWGLSLADRVLLSAVYYRTNLTFRQIALLFGISKSAANRIVEHVAPLLVVHGGQGPVVEDEHVYLRQAGATPRLIDRA